MVISLGCVRPEVDGELRLDPQDVAPFHGPVIGELLPLQQPVDQGGTLVPGIAIVDELARLLGGGERADQVKVGAADEHGIRAENRPESQRRQFGENNAIDGIQRSRRGRIFINSAVVLRHRGCMRGD